MYFSLFIDLFYFLWEYRTRIPTARSHSIVFPIGIYCEAHGIGEGKEVGKAREVGKGRKWGKGSGEEKEMGKGSKWGRAESEEWKEVGEERK